MSSQQFSNAGRCLVASFPLTGIENLKATGNREAELFRAGSVRSTKSIFVGQSAQSSGGVFPSNRASSSEGSAERNNTVVETRLLSTGTGRATLNQRHGSFARWTRLGLDLLCASTLDTPFLSLSLSLILCVLSAISL